MKFKKLFIFMLICELFLFFKNIYAQDKESVGNIANVVGKVDLIQNGKTLQAVKEFPIYETDVIVTHDNSAVKINFKDGSNYMAFQNSQIKVSEYKIKNNKSGGANLKSAIDIAKGTVRFFVKPKENGFNESRIGTPNSVMLIRGTGGESTFTPGSANEEGLSEFKLSEGTTPIANKNNLTKQTILVGGFWLIVYGVKPPSLPQKLSLQELNRLKQPPLVFASAPAAGRKIQQENNKEEEQKENGNGVDLQKNGDTKPVQEQGQQESPAASKTPLVMNTDGSSTPSVSTATQVGVAKLSSTSQTPATNKISAANAAMAIQTQSVVNHVQGAGSSLGAVTTATTNAIAKSLKTINIHINSP